MNPDADPREAKKVAIARWADKYTARFDQALTDAWPDLESRLHESIAKLSSYELMAGPGKGFQAKCIDPAVAGWIERHVQPVIEDAGKEFREKIQGEPGMLQSAFHADAPGERVLHTGDVLIGLALPAGLLMSGGSVTAAIATTTKLLIFTTVVVNWPLLIGGLIAGTVFCLIGTVSLAGLKGRMRERFENRLMPHLKNAVVGEGIVYRGEHIPSLKDQLKPQVRDVAARALNC
jgi:hypothetical protein